jgi:succinyl-diaminopimelate desuccinylase
MDKLLQELIAIPSVCANIPESVRIIDLMEQKLSDLGLHTSRHAKRRFPSLVATTQKTKTPKVMLYAHLDVVDAPSSLFSLRLEGGKYHGRGTLDMKSAAAVYLNVLTDMQPLLNKYDIGVMFTSDEEYFGMYGAGMLVQEGYRPGVCLMPDSAFGPGWDIEYFAKGCWFANITSLGISAHGSRPWEGSSASIKLIKALEQINELFKDMQRPETATLNIGIMQGGNSVNQIPAAAMASLDIRFTDYAVYKQLKQEIAGICDRFDVNLRTIRKANKPTYNDLSHPLIATFARHVETQTGITPKPFSTHGSTDARFLVDKGVPCILTSPPGGGAHSNEEWIDKEGYEQFHIILRNYLDDVARCEHQTSTEALTIIP